jgi:hypothetical protein
MYEVIASRHDLRNLLTGPHPEPWIECETLPIVGRLDQTILVAMQFMNSHEQSNHR